MCKCGLSVRFPATSPSLQPNLLQTSLLSPRVRLNFMSLESAPAPVSVGFYGEPSWPSKMLPQESEASHHIQTPCHPAPWSHFYWTSLLSPIVSSQLTKWLTLSHPVLCQILPWSHHQIGLPTGSVAPSDVVPLCCPAAHHSAAQLLSYTTAQRT